MRRLAYLFPAFPVLHQTFTVGEVLGLKRRGYDLRLISLKSAHPDLQQPEARALIGETLYCPRLVSPAVWRVFLRALATRPGDLAGLLGHVWRAWCGGRVKGKGKGHQRADTFSLTERVEIFYSSNSFFYLLKSIFLVPYALYIADYLEREKIDHVHSHWATYPTTVAMMIKQWSGVPFSFTAHAYDIYMIGRMLPAKLDQASFVVTCAQTNRRHLQKFCDNGAARRIYVNYHGADLERFSPTRKEAGRYFRVMSCGWLKEYKGFHYLLDSIALLVERGVPVYAELAGDGPQRGYLESQAARLGIADKVHFHGYVDHDRLAALYAGADVFALPSVIMGRYGRQDVIPNVLAEAMAAGLPAVASDVAGIPELLEDGISGLLVPERDSEALADALERLWREPETARRFARAARLRVEDIWDRNKNLKELAGIIDCHLPDE